jgi:hypothetical protein
MKRATLAALLAAGILGSLPSLAHSPRSTIAALVVARASSSGAAAARSPSGPDLKIPRATSDRPDAVSGPQTHVIYFVPIDRRDQRLDTNGTIARSVASMVAWFKQQAGRKPRMDLRRGGALDVTFVRGGQVARAYTSLEAIRDEVAVRGFAAAGKRYLVYAAVPTGDTCGEAEWPGRYTAVFLDSSPGCRARDFGSGTVAGSGGTEVIAAQEWLHNEGIVSPVAVHECLIAPGHVCTTPLALLSPQSDPEQRDVMFPFVTGLRLSQKVIDTDHLDYFRQPLPTPNLANSAYMQ